VRFDIENKKLSLFGFIRTGGDLLLLYSYDYAIELAKLFVPHLKNMHNITEVSICLD
jgi:hypothetical protein